MLGSFNDIRKMQDVLKKAQLGLWVIEFGDSGDPRMYADQNMLDLLGIKEKITPEECYKQWYDNIESGYYPMIEQAVQQSIQQIFSIVQYPWHHPQNGRVFVRCGGIRDNEYAEGVRIKGFHQNISDTIKLFDEKRYLEELNEEILSSLHKLFYVVYRVDLFHNKIATLRMADDMIPVLADESNYSIFIKKTIERFIHPDDKERIGKELSYERLMENKKQEMEKYTIEYRRLFEDTYRWVSATVYYGDERTADDSAVIAMQDINGQKREEEKNRQIMLTAYEAAQQANRAKNDFLSRMSHDIRTPMNAIMGMTTLAVANMDNPERLKDCLEKIKVSGKLMVELVNEVLDMSKIESGNYQLNLSRFRLSELLQNICVLTAPMMQEREQTLTMDMDRIIHDGLVGDTLRIQQVLMNIVSNASKYSSGGGVIGLQVQELSGAGDQYARLQIKITDNGIGMEKEFLPHIFEPFSRAEDSRVSKISGTGLGLAITQSLVQMMEGAIHVESELGRGSCFTIILNLAIWECNEEGAYGAASKEKEIDITKLQLTNQTVLLVEDNELNQEIAKAILEMSGVSVVTANNGKEAVDFFMESQPGRFSAIFMDIQMPIMNGTEAASVIRSLERKDAAKIPIIAMTANAFAEDVLQSRQAGMNEHIAKPIDVGQLAAILKKWLVEIPLKEEHDDKYEKKSIDYGCLPGNRGTSGV